jgi:ABC-type lipoprotein export system ATPase subunit
VRPGWGILPAPSGGPGAAGEALRLEAVSHRFPGGDQLFQPISAVFAPGLVHAVVGPSGSGKSTLLGIVAGWIAPERGTVWRPAGLRVAWVFQNPHGVARRSALDHVVFPFLAAGRRRAEAVPPALALLRQFGLAATADRSYGDLSGGERLRLMLARAVASRPGLLLVDEPTAQLDASAAATVNRAIAQMAGAGIITLVATHDPKTSAACHQVIALRPPAPEPDGDGGPGPGLDGLGGRLGQSFRPGAGLLAAPAWMVSAVVSASRPVPEAD